LTCGSLSTWVQVRDGVGGETKKKRKNGWFLVCIHVWLYTWGYGSV
jgi:hypothetical protein